MRTTNRKICPPPIFQILLNGNLPAVKKKPGSGSDQNTRIWKDPDPNMVFIVYTLTWIHQLKNSQCGNPIKKLSTRLYITLGITMINKYKISTRGCVNLCSSIAFQGPNSRKLKKTLHFLGPISNLVCIIFRQLLNTKETLTFRVLWTV